MRPEWPSHSFTVRSSEPEAMNRPSEEKAAVRTRSLCPVISFRSRPEARSQSRRLLSTLPETSVLSSGENATAYTLAGRIHCAPMGTPAIAQPVVLDPGRGALGQRFLQTPTIVAWDLDAFCCILPLEARSP